MENSVPMESKDELLSLLVDVRKDIDKEDKKDREEREKSSPLKRREVTSN